MMAWLFPLLCLSGSLSASPATDTLPQSPAVLHFRPEKGVLGDTIPFYRQGEYHVFYLKGSSWGHIASKDLLHWVEYPEALKTGKHPTDPDGENCWTGSIVEKDGRFHLFYTGKNSRDPEGDQKVMQAESTDLVYWKKKPNRTFYADGRYYWSKPVNGAIDDKIIYHHQAFRDPEVVWNAAEKQWWMTLHAVQPDGLSPVFARYISADLIHWTPSAPLLIFSRNFSGDCPHLFPAEDRWYLIAADRHYTAAEALGGPFSPEMLPYECGELFVPKTMFDGVHRILVGWIADREEGKDSGKGCWGGVMCMPREIYARDGRLFERPLPAILSAYVPQPAPAGGGLQPGTALTMPADYTLRCLIDRSDKASEAVITFRGSSENPDDGYRLRLRFAEGMVSLGDAYRHYEQACAIQTSDTILVRAFISDTVIECFINDAWCFTMRAYNKAGRTLRIEAPAGGIQVRDFEWALLPES